MSHQTNTGNATSTPPAEKIAAAAAAATGSPASLLWAHQLRREHKALVSRTDQLEGKLSFSKEGAETGITSVTSRLDELEGCVRELRGEIGDLRSGMETLRKWKDEMEREKKECEEREREKMIKREERLEGEIAEEIRGLDCAVKELREKVDKGVRREDYGTPPSAQPQPAKRDVLDIPSTVSGTQTASNANSQIRQSSPLVPESCPSLSSRPSSIVRDRQPSPILGGNSLEPCGVPVGSDSENLLATLSQGIRSLSCYLEFGESVLAKFPRRRDEAKVVEKFWEGLIEVKIRNSVEERLEKDGWTWNVLKEAVNANISQTTTQKPNGQGVRGKKRKKPRAMPLIWSGEGEGEGDEWLHNFRKVD